MKKQFAQIVLLLTILLTTNNILLKTNSGLQYNLRNNLTYSLSQASVSNSNSNSNPPSAPPQIPITSLDPSVVKSKGNFHNVAHDATQIITPQIAFPKIEVHFPSSTIINASVYIDKTKKTIFNPNSNEKDSFGTEDTSIVKKKTDLDLLIEAKQALINEKKTSVAKSETELLAVEGDLAKQLEEIKALKAKIADDTTSAKEKQDAELSLDGKYKANNETKKHQLNLKAEIAKLLDEVSVLEEEINALAKQR